MSKRILLQFLGANGFPCAAYTPMLNEVSHIITTTRMRRTPSVQITVEASASDVFRDMENQSNWKQMIQTLIRAVEARGEPVVGLGHSFGGAMMVCAASARPELFQKLIIVDPPMFYPFKRAVWGVALHLPAQIRNRVHPMVAGALRRRAVFQSREDAAAFLRQRSLFKSLDQRCFDAYIKHCLVPRNGNSQEVELLFPPTIEAKIYETFPLDLHPDDSKHIGQYRFKHNVPDGWLMYSTKHQLIDRHDVKYILRSLPSLKPEPFEQGHFWPLEDPQGFAARVGGLLCGGDSESPTHAAAAASTTGNG